LVMPRSSSFIGSIRSVGRVDTRRGDRRLPIPPRCVRCYFVSDDGDSTAIEPSMMPALIVSSSPARSEGTSDS